MKKILEVAKNMRQHAYVPHSNFRVGAALLTEDGTIIGGCNIESDSYGLTICAERNAIFTAIAQGHQKFKSLAVVTSIQGTPCGACRQIIAEHCGNISVVTADLAGNQKKFTAYELLPHHFSLAKSVDVKTEEPHE